MKTNLISTLLIGIVTMLAIPAEAAEPMTQPRKPSSSKEVSAARGQHVYVELCATCHGIKGKGDGPRSTFFPEGQYIPNLSDPGIVNGRDDEITENIREGLRRFDEEFITMPQFKYILSNDDIKSALAYIKTLSSKAKAKK
jgi:mono/diheme cytochrome c family protein